MSVVPPIFIGLSDSYSLPGDQFYLRDFCTFRTKEVTRANSFEAYKNRYTFLDNTIASQSQLFAQCQTRIIDSSPKLCVYVITRRTSPKRDLFKVLTPSCILK
jgi:hypothetical protein